eukprot:s2021_g2.t1
MIAVYCWLKRGGQVLVVMVELDGSIQLDCDHRLCDACFRSYVALKIREGQVASHELSCPLPDCGVEVTVAQVEGATDAKLFEKFLQFRMELWKPPAADGQMVDCPTPECGKFLVATGVSFVRCPRCTKDLLTC